MRLSHGLQLAYCTNVHRGESWDQTFAALQRDTLAVRDRVGAGHPYAIGLRLGNDAARQLASPATLQGFRTWLDQENCYVFTINGFPYGQFHGTRVKERVYTPDWTTPERLAYTCLLFDLLAELVPNTIEGSISTVPVSFKGFHLSASARAESRRNLWRCLDHIETTTKRSGKRLHLGLEPEPLCTLETTAETVLYFDELRSERPGDPRLDQFLGVNYDCCHLAVEFEDPSAAIQRLRSAGIFLSKIHLSNALRVQPSAEVLTALQSFVDTVYFHQVIARDARTGALTRYEDLDQALRFTASCWNRASAFFVSLWSFETAAIGAEINARITKLPAREGDRFKTGDVLVQFDCRKLDAEHDAAVAAFEGHRAAFENASEMAKFQAAGSLSVEQARYEMQRAEAEARGLAARRDGCTVVAPFDGRVTEKIAQVYEIAQPNQPLIKIINEGKLELVLIVPSNWLVHLPQGSEFSVEVDETQEIYKARIVQSTGLIDPVSQTARLIGEIAGQAPHLFPGMSGTAIFPTDWALK